MLAYVMLGTNDFERAKGFYDELLGVIGVSRMMGDDRVMSWGKDGGVLAVGRPYDGEPATVGNGVMVSISAKDREEVDKLHAKALSLGARDEGAPGVRGESFYIGYCRDLDGNKLAFFAFAA